MKTNHHFNDRDTTISYMVRCIPNKREAGLQRWEAVSACLSEYRHKWTNKNNAYTDKAACSTNEEQNKKKR